MNDIHIRKKLFVLIDDKKKHQESSNFFLFYFLTFQVSFEQDLILPKL